MVGGTQGGMVDKNHFYREIFKIFLHISERKITKITLFFHFFDYFLIFGKVQKHYTALSSRLESLLFNICSWETVFFYSAGPVRPDHYFLDKNFRLSLKVVNDYLVIFRLIHLVLVQVLAMPETGGFNRSSTAPIGTNPAPLIQLHFCLDHVILGPKLCVTR